MQPSSRLNKWTFLLSFPHPGNKENLKLRKKIDRVGIELVCNGRLKAKVWHQFTTYTCTCSASLAPVGLYGSEVALKWGASDDWRATKHGVGGHGGKRQCKTRKQSGGDHTSGFVLCNAQARIVTRHCEGAKSQFKVMNHKSKGPIQALFGSLMIGSEMTQDKQCIVSFKFPDWDVLKNLSDFEDLAGGVLGCSQASLSSPYHSSWSIARVCITTDPPIWPDSINITFPPAVE